MKIIKLDVEGFRSLRSQTWCPGDLNVLIGPNAAWTGRDPDDRMNRRAEST